MKVTMTSARVALAGAIHAHAAAEAELLDLQQAVARAGADAASADAALMAFVNLDRQLAGHRAARIRSGAKSLALAPEMAQRIRERDAAQAEATAARGAWEELEGQAAAAVDVLAERAHSVQLAVSGVFRETMDAVAQELAGLDGRAAALRTFLKAGLASMIDVRQAGEFAQAQANARPANLSATREMTAAWTGFAQMLATDPAALPPPMPAAGPAPQPDDPAAAEAESHARFNRMMQAAQAAAPLTPWTPGGDPNRRPGGALADEADRQRLEGGF